MPECEMCGKEGAGYVALVEGAKLKVCEDCSTMGKVLSKPVKEFAKESAVQASFAKNKTELEIVDDCAKRIREGREKMGLTLAVIAERISEKESFLRKVESGHAIPTETLAKKLEKELRIKLFEESTSGRSGVGAGKKDGGENTLLDLLEMQKRKK